MAILMQHIGGNLRSRFTDFLTRCCSTNCKRIEKPMHSRDSVRI
ncbi:MAG: DUF1572 domain-containing protein [bacterium]|nr:DUF1572 domain-containing protein [bacterium]